MSTEPDNIAVLDADGCVYVPPPQQMRIEQTTEMVVFNESGEFDAAAYPDAQYIRVRAVGGGGGSSGAETPDYGVNVTIGASGGAGSYAESIFNIGDLPTGPIPVWVGQGGAGGASAPAGGTPTAGENGTWSAFGGGSGPPSTDGLLVAMWGMGAGISSDSQSATDWILAGGSPSYDHSGAFPSHGQLVVSGGGGEPSFAFGPEILGADETLAIGGAGGSNALSSRNSGSLTRLHPGRNGLSYGGSTATGNVPYGSGGVAPVGSFDGVDSETGHPGADGIVIIEVYSARIVGV